MLNPISTYRIQFHKDFTLGDFTAIIPYLKELSVATIYASPIFEASPGSTHGYDTVNPHRINPEIGTLEELRTISKKLKELGINWVQDIVPNHMAFHPNNSWLMDVLQKGRKSEYADFFDINWSGDKELPLMVPFLGSSLEDAIQKGELKLIDKEGQIKLQYFETEWPVNDQVKDIHMSLHDAVDLQYYRPCSWQETNYQINYRRFFTVNNLICLNMQHEQTFSRYHEFIKSLVDEGIFQGLRLDHIDGLYDPETYLDRLRQLVGKEVYIVVEKILEEGESIPVSWPIQGNTGYDFLAQVNNLFTDTSGKKAFTQYYESFTGDDKPIGKQILQKKAGILANHMAGELDNLYTLFLELQLAGEEEVQALKAGSVQDAIGQLLICCPVYRYYGSSLPLSGANKTGMQQVFEEIAVVKSLRPAAELLKKILIDQPEEGDEGYNARAAAFYLRCMQLSGPLMAKGVEDTLMYTYSRFIGHNEVGDAPAAFGVSRDDFHHLMAKRQQYWPLSMNGTSTHDTKRGEDVRARLNVLSARSKEWIAKAQEWHQLNEQLSGGIDRSDEYFIYQTIAGSYPMPGTAADDYRQRLQEYLQKALREGKVNSDWADPDTAYEQLINDFIGALLDPSGDFWPSFTAFHTSLSDLGIINSLAQMLVKFTAPGIPDVYQGTELWDLSLVDPDNRRPVDYKEREGWLKDVKDPATTLAALWKERYNGKVKLLLAHLLLQVRKKNPELLTEGTYIPLKVKGRFAEHVFAFARRRGAKWMITAIPLHMAQLTDEKGLLTFDWKDTRIELSSELPSLWLNVLTNEEGELNHHTLPVKMIFNQFPLALVELEHPANDRAAGILLAVSSLPSRYGIGDFGPEAKEFIDFLARSGQKYWQLLPMNPSGADQAFSPYSSVSAMAGNTLLISPFLLIKDGLLEEKQVRKYEIMVKENLDFEVAANIKNRLLKKAYEQFMLLKSGELPQLFRDFCVKETAWLNDFSLYIVLKEYQGHTPWYEWQQEYRFRNEEALKAFSDEHADELNRVKWQQFIFFRQWAALKAYATTNGVQFYGDLPFYLGHDSAEVWAHREYFSLDKDGQITGIAGVPPDYFNADGQLWGMPVYCWDKLKADGYRWWLQRIRKNMELYDLLRLDHFRAFADYWEVPAGEKTAMNGQWKTGPGADFFDLLKAEFPDLPFIAEDLGEITPEVFSLRDRFNLAGMKVLQFAFGKNIGESDYIPHRYESDNFVVYTGTHDNDTTIGWYDHEAGKAERKNLKKYTGRPVGRNNVHIVLAQLAYASVARIAILPMQDVLGLGGEARMNKPASVKGNWTWCMRERPAKDVEKRLRQMVRLYGRV